MIDRNAEVAQKLATMRAMLAEAGATAFLLRGTDWFAWATAGGSNTVLLAQESGIAEVLVTAEGAWVLTDEIEAARLRDEELPESLLLQVFPWEDARPRDAFIVEHAKSGHIFSDRPRGTEQPLPAPLIAAKQQLLPSEIERYREVGRLAAEAMTEVLVEAKPEWTEYQLAGAGAEAMWSRGLHPTLTLAAGKRRVFVHRHPTPSDARLENYAMLVFCARRYGLYANLTRFVSFGAMSAEIPRQHALVHEIEAQALDATRAGSTLAAVYATLAEAYAANGVAQAIKAHHQGGSTGYLSRETVAMPATKAPIYANQAFAWNPSLPGVKVEDTFLLRASGELENLTYDPAWPSHQVKGRARPEPLVR